MLLHEHQQVFFFDASFDMKFTINDFFCLFFKCYEYFSNDLQGKEVTF